MTRQEMFRGQPLWVRCTWWTLTAITLIYVAPLLAAALVNPFWFRDSFFAWVEQHIRNLGSRRDEFMRPVFRKYRLFTTIKESS